jgi:hypothetical protein
MPHALQVRRELVIDGDFPDWGADAGDLQAVLGKSLQERAQLATVEIEDVGSPSAADLHEAQAEAGSDLALLGEVVGDLVDKS